METTEGLFRAPMTREALLLAMQSGWPPAWLFFWGHQPAKDGAISASCFSQWWAAHPFAVEGVRYATAEHYMMAEKARLFGDENSRAAILKAESPAQAKALGRKVSGFDETAWRAARSPIVTRGNLAKFQQHAALRGFLLATGDRVLVEASPHDRIWGIGMAANDSDAENPAKWKGLNLLGFSLMEVRQQLANATDR